MAFNPYFFWDSPLPLELIHKALKELADIKPTVEELKTKVDELVDELDTTIKDEVARVINEMYENGDFDAILESAADEYFAKHLKIERSTILDFERVFRQLKVTGNYMYNQPDASIAADDTRTAHYATSQGGCRYIDENNEERFVIIYICNDATPFQLDNNGVIEVYDRVGNLVNSRTFTASEIGHGQYICYHNGYFYFGGDIVGDDASNHKIRYVKSDLTGAVNYVLLSNFNRLNGIAEYNGRVWITNALKTEIDVAELDFEDDGYTPKATVINPLVMDPANIQTAIGTVRNDTTFSGGFSVTENYYYFGTYKPEGIIRCRRNFTTVGTELIETRFTPDWYFSIKKNLDNDMYFIGEPEWITVLDNGDVWLSTTQHLNTKAVAMHDITQVFKQNLYNNLNLSRPITNATGRSTVYADNISENPPLNPDGSETKPFRTIDEAVWWFNNYPHSDYCSFLLKGNHPYIVWCIGKNYRIIGNASYQDYSGAPSATNTSGDTVKMSMIGNVCQYGGYVELYNCAVYPTLHYLISSTYDNEKYHGITVDNGQTTIVNTGVAGGNNPNILGAMHIRNAMVNFTWNNSLANTVNFSQHSFVAHFGGHKRYYLDTGNCTFNGHSDLTWTQNGYNSDGTVKNLGNAETDTPNDNIMNFIKSI